MACQAVQLTRPNEYAGNRMPPIEHLARVVFLGRDWRKCYMAFARYSDASGGLINAAKVISGYIASVEDWQRFDTEQSKKINESHYPSIIVSSSGMVTGFGSSNP